MAARLSIGAAARLVFLMPIGLGGCSAAGAPSFDLFGAFFPAWLLCGIIGIAGAAVARVVDTGVLRYPVPTQYRRDLRGPAAATSRFDVLSRALRGVSRSRGASPFATLTRSRRDEGRAGPTCSLEYFLLRSFS